MKLGIHTNQAEMQKTRTWVYTPEGYEYGQEENQVIFHLRPWTRTTQGYVDKRAKQKNLAIMDADDALKKIGTGDKRAEAYLRELADFLIADWENVVYATDVPELGVRAGDPIPCTAQYKVLLFEDVSIAVAVVEAAKKFATVQFADELGNSERSSGGMAALEA